MSEHPVCTSLLFTLLFIKSQYTVFSFFVHLIVFCTSCCFFLGGGGAKEELSGVMRMSRFYVYLLRLSSKVSSYISLPY